MTAGQPGSPRRQAMPRSALPARALPSRPRPRGHGSEPPAAEAVREAPGVWTAANIVTLVRVVATFFWIALALWVGPNDPATGAYAVPLGIAVAATFGLIAFTDTLDGYLARSRGEITDLGKFLDPIADKLICVGALLVLLDWGYVSVWVPVVIVFREFLVSGLRMAVAAKGEVVAASMLGKWKTGFTMGAIAGYLVGAALPEGALGTLLLGAAWLAMAVAVVLTIWSGVDYFLKCRRYLL